MPNSKEKSLILVLVMITSFITPFIGTSVNLALPIISNLYHMNAVTMSWVTMSVLLSSAVFLVPIGKLADIIGRKRVFIWGNIVLSVSSIFCAISPSGTFLIVFRVIQGIGSAMMYATGIALITSVFPPNERGKAIGLNVTAVYIGLSAAPVIGGFMISGMGWRSLFYVPAALGFPSAITLWLTVKTEWAEAKNEKFDVWGSVIFVIAMSTFMYGLSKLPDKYAILLTVFGLFGLILFVWIENRKKYPVLDVSLFKQNKLFAFSNAAALINYATTFAITFVLSLYLQYIKGMTPREAGMLLVIQPILMAIVASWSGKLSDTKDPRVLASLGMAVIAIGLALLIPIGSKTSTTYLGIVLALLGLGFGLFSSPNTNAIMGSVEKKYLGLASGTVATMRLTGQVISMAIATLVVHVYLGNQSINPTNFRAFINGSATIFAIFMVLSIGGIWISLARGSKINQGNL
ncbi:MAG TPA: MFS transporter [Tenuifilaceae bacterium]|nr:MFS transporter [Tenuifilaceae bacterium]